VKQAKEGEGEGESGIQKKTRGSQRNKFMSNRAVASPKKFI
jgi:hypothetical protein